MNADRIVMLYSDGRSPVKVRDVVRDNMTQMRREHLTLSGEVYGWVTADAIEQTRVTMPDIRPFGYYS